MRVSDNLDGCGLWEAKYLREEVRPVGAEEEESEQSNGHREREALVAVPDVPHLLDEEKRAATPAGDNPHDERNLDPEGGRAERGEEGNSYYANDPSVPEKPGTAQLPRAVFAAAEDEPQDQQVRDAPGQLVEEDGQVVRGRDPEVGLWDDGLGCGERDVAPVMFGWCF